MNKQAHPISRKRLQKELAAHSRRATRLSLPCYTFGYKRRRDGRSYSTEIGGTHFFAFTESQLALDLIQCGVPDGAVLSYFPAQRMPVERTNSLYGMIPSSHDGDRHVFVPEALGVWSATAHSVHRHTFEWDQEFVDQCEGLFKPGWSLTGTHYTLHHGFSGRVAHNVEHAAVLRVVDLADRAIAKLLLGR